MVVNGSIRQKRSKSIRSDGTAGDLVHRAPPQNPARTPKACMYGVTALRFSTRYDGQSDRDNCCPKEEPNRDHLRTRRIKGRESATASEGAAAAG